jgi:hypothetical protein
MVIEVAGRHREMIGNIDSRQSTETFAVEEFTRFGEDFVLGWA